MKYAHVGLNVTNLEKSIEFYSKLFGAEPVKVKPDYAKFLLETPGLNFTLNLRDEVKGNQVGHFGFQVESTDEVIAHKNRLEENGILSQYDEINTTCCYALQDKFWIHDPDGNEWEFFYTKADVAASSENASSCCVPEKPKTKEVECCSTTTQNANINSCCS
ncbi:ArsI/CadI family heavy metal resistance metalloenzyme [Bacillus salipaludis]|uniref:ArsI/CadI family heavy metal resistance metalloenzyme n=1 Tax=Bacillus salipaludis TaxID=2547811 RepID=A0AA90QWG3_9BACI|nr:ArsI/CadI family heavy metal resistance metalloenzyme [Bacillus salipaludis]MDQ6598039.1 ArsI/CadI family heavy metal resistance metalloenzyme [Bacillus salipaludis]